MRTRTVSQAMDFALAPPVPRVQRALMSAFLVEGAILFGAVAAPQPVGRRRSRSRRARSGEVVSTRPVGGAATSDDRDFMELGRCAAWALRCCPGDPDRRGGECQPWRGLRAGHAPGCDARPAADAPGAVEADRRRHPFRSLVRGGLRHRERPAPGDRGDVRRCGRQHAGRRDAPQGRRTAARAGDAGVRARDEPPRSGWLQARGDVPRRRHLDDARRPSSP